MCHTASSVFLSCLLIAASVSFPITASHASETPTLILDEADPSPTFTKTGYSWFRVYEGYKTKSYKAYKSTSSSSLSTAQWTATLEPGFYRVSVTYKASSINAQNAVFTLKSGYQELGTEGVVKSVSINQQVPPASLVDQGVAWQDIASVPLLYRKATITLTNAISGNGMYVVADAVRFEKIRDLTEQEMQLTIVSHTPLPDSEGEGEAPSIVDVLVLFDPLMINDKFGGSVSAFENLVQTMFNCGSSPSLPCGSINRSINSAVSDSLIPGKFSIVSIEAHNKYYEPNTHPDDVIDDVAMDPVVNKRRNELHADIVLYFADDKYDSHILGTTYFVPYEYASTFESARNAPNFSSHPWKKVNAEFPFTLVTITSGLHPVIITAHELSHLLGAGHENAPHPLEPWARGYSKDGYFRTVESTDSACPLYGCGIVAFFSNPLVTVTTMDNTTGKISTFPAGVANQYDNARTMTKMFPIVAAYSERSPITFTNPHNCLDVYPDGEIVPRDALHIVNYLNSHTAEQYQLSTLKNSRKEFFESKYVDVNGDGFVTPLDNLMVVNYLNEPNNPAFQPENVCPR